MRRSRRPASARTQSAALARAASAIQKARAHARRDIVHRAIRHGRLDAWAVAESLAVATALCVVLWLLREPVMVWWREVIAFWAPAVGMPLKAGSDVQRLLVWTVAEPLPSRRIELATAALVVGAYAATYRMPDATTPLKYLVRIVCAVQATALVYFLVIADSFPYTVTAHVESVLTSSFGLMLSVPVLMTFGYGMLRIPLLWRVVHPAVVLAFFVVEVPHAAAVHILVLQHLSILFMPVLYMCFGVLFQTMVFVGLYSSLVSRLPADAVT